jgi:CheY-like chemotaxis protein
MSAPANADLRFLVVDALAGVQTFARQLLEGFGFPAHSIRCASDTDSALALGLEFKPDFLITDWFAKAGMNGIALYQRLKTGNPGCRLALLSFEVTPAHEAEAHAAGSRFLLRKPFTADDLRNTMQRSLELLATERPELAQRLNAVIKAQQGPGKLPVKLALPPLPPLPPQLRAGDRVQYGSATDTVQFVVVRSGELVVQLKGKPELVPAHKLQRL